MLSFSFAILLATSPCPAALCLLCISFLSCCFVAVHTFNTDFNVLFPQKLFSLVILVFFFLPPSPLSPVPNTATPPHCVSGRPAADAASEAEAGCVWRDAGADCQIQHGLHGQGRKVSNSVSFWSRAFFFRLSSSFIKSDSLGSMFLLTHILSRSVLFFYNVC